MKQISTLILLLSLLTLRVDATQAQDSIDKANFNTALFEQVLLQKINEYRVAKGRKALKADSSVYATAKDHNDFLKTQKNLTHNQPKAVKKSVKERLQLYTKAASFAAAENLARTFVLIPAYNYDSKGNTKLSTANTYEEAAIYMLNAWIQSTFHHKNLLNETYTLSGISAYFNPTDKSLTTTQVFATIY